VITARVALQISIDPPTRIPEKVIDLVPDREANTYAMADNGLRKETPEHYLTNLMKRADAVVDRVTISGPSALTEVALVQPGYLPLLPQH
jgi:hypothetical protein